MPMHVTRSNNEGEKEYSLVGKDKNKKVVSVSLTEKESAAYMAKFYKHNSRGVR